MPFAPDTESPVSRRKIFQIAWPIILSNISVPLLGLVDTAVIGNLGDAALIGAIAVGAMIFSFVYWGFGFLRMGTTGLIAQACGARNTDEIKATIYRAMLVGLTIGTVLIALQLPLSVAAFYLIDGSANVENAAVTYFDIRIWSAPATLINLAILGFFLGQQDSRTTLKLQLILNGTNIVLDLIFVLGFGWDVAGVAAATLIAEYVALTIGLYLAIRSLKRHDRDLRISLDRLFDAGAMVHTLAVNRDILIRTLCLIFAFAWFTNQGAQAGDVLLAANAVLMQLVSFAAFFLDGFALSAESLVGHAVGRRNMPNLRRSILLSTQFAVGTAAILSLIFYFLGGWIVSLITNVESVVAACHIYLPWAILSPIISVWCYQLDGIFIGATRTREMRNAMIISLILYLATWWILSNSLGNHGLWASLMLYFLYRAGTLLAALDSIAPGIFSRADPTKGHAAS
jgi:MATE family multidrug resistance protein